MERSLADQTAHVRRSGHWTAVCPSPLAGSAALALNQTPDLPGHAPDNVTEALKPQIDDAALCSLLRPERRSIRSGIRDTDVTGVR